MKTLLKIAFLFLFTLQFQNYAPAQTPYWRQIFGGPFNDIAHNCIQIRNYCYLMSGEKEIILPNTHFIIQKSYLVKFDKYGSIIWEKIIGDSNIANISVTLAEDLNGNIFLPYRNGLNSHIVKLDSGGNVIWDKEFTKHGIASFRGISFVDNYKKIVLFSLSFINSLLTTSITKIDSSGSLIWNKVFYDSIPTISIYRSGNNSFYFTNNNYYISGVALGNIGFILKTDTSGKVIWNNRYNDNWGIYSVAQNSDISLIVSGRAEEAGYLRCIKIDTSGSVIWSRSYRNDTLAGGIGYNKIIKNNENNFALGTPSGNNFGRLMIIDSSGNILSSRFYNYPEEFYVSQYNINNTSDSGYIIAGSLDSNNFLDQELKRGDKQIDVLVYKIDKLGNTVFIGNSETFIPNNFSLNVYPNPFNNEFKILFNLNKKSNVVISLFDILGRKIRIIENAIYVEGNYSLKVSTPELSSGIYFLKSNANQITVFNKIVLLK